MDFDYLDDFLDEDGGAPEDEAVGDGYRHICVVVELEGTALAQPSLEALGQARNLADQIGVYVYAVLLGEDVGQLGESLVAYGADRVLVIEDAALTTHGYQPEVYVAVLADIVERYRPEILLLAASPQGNDLAPRLAQALETGLVSHCIRLEMDMSERLLLGTFAVMDGEVYHTFACPEARPQMATLEPGYFPEPYRDAHRAGSIDSVAPDLDPGTITRSLGWIDMEAEPHLPEVPLTGSRIVVSAGRGMLDTEGYALVENLADALGGRVAGSRGAFDEGWIEMEQVVGIGGERISPDLYIACGVSGDIHHCFGIQGSRFVVSINPDPDAPINKVANMAIVADAREVIPAMLKALEA